MRDADSGPMLMVRVWFESGPPDRADQGFRARIIRSPNVASAREETTAVSSRDAVLEVVRAWLDTLEP